MKNIWSNYGLTISLFGCFLVSQIGLSVVGLHQLNHQQLWHHQPLVSYIDYLHSMDFLETTMENWESEFLQMFVYVIFTASLFQRGSAESKAPGKPDDVDADPRLAALKPTTPWPVKRGGVVLKIYENSLSTALFLLFSISFFLHAVGGAAAYSDEQQLHGGHAVSTWQYFATAQFWFESLQNWQSEFFSIGMMVLLSIFLRQRGSPESKPVAAPHWENA